MNETPVIIICLDSLKKERCDKTSKLLEKHFKNIHVLKAATPDDFDIENVTDPSVLRIIKDDLPAIHPNTHYQVHNAKHVACALSHQKAWKMVKNMDQPAIIAEDDLFVHLNDEQLRKIDKSLRHLPASADIFNILSIDGVVSKKGSKKSSKKNSKKNIFDPVLAKDIGIGAAFYWINPRICGELLKSSGKVHTPMDQYVRLAHKGKFKNMEAYIPKKSIMSNNTITTVFKNKGSTLSHYGIPKWCDIPSPIIFKYCCIGLSLLCLILLIILYSSSKKNPIVNE